MQWRWHGRFNPVRAGQDAMVLLAQDETLSLAGSQWAGVINRLDAAANPCDPGQPRHSWGPQDEYVMAQLLLQDLLEPGDPAAPHPQWQLPDFAASPVWQFDGRVIRLASTCPATWLAPLLDILPGVIVLVDDYLDPRLAAIEWQMRQDRMPWTLLRHGNNRSWLGPLFRPDADGAACWHCMAWRLQHNQPARLWASRRHGALWPLPVPLAAPPAPEVVAHLLASCRALLDQPAASSLWQIPARSGSPASCHRVLRRPNCPACGDPGLFAARQARPPQWQQDGFLPGPDGGLRRDRPADTLARLQPWVDPVTGVLASLEPLPQSTAKAEMAVERLAIYRAAAFVAPREIHRWQPDPFVRMALGKGISATQSCVSALCEGLERHNAQYQDDEACIFSLPDALPHRAIRPQQLAPFSASQYAMFAALDSAGRESLQGVLPWHDAMPLHWSMAWSLRQQQPCYLPSSYCFANTPFADATYCRWGGNGCAAGNTLEEAALQGLLELIERDAVAIWWYNRIPRPALDLASLPSAAVQRIDATLGPDWQYWVLDLTHDLAIPVMVAIGQQRETGQFILGMGCHPDAGLAALRALTELCQLLPVRNQGKMHFNFDEIVPAPWLFPAATVRPASAIEPSASILSVLQDCVAKVHARDLEVILLDYSRPDIPVVTVNMAVPGLCHIWPHFGCQRLYAVPPALGWCEAALTEADLNPQRLML